jgi:hypothetical protein
MLELLFVPSPPFLRSDLDGRPYSYVYEHFAEPRHATEAITATAEEFIRQHTQRNAAGGACISY